jgi:phage tail sheath protein FI
MLSFMATGHKAPGVYVEEMPGFPPSVEQVETAIAAFIGYTQNDTYNGLSLLNKPTRVSALKEYEAIFGMPQAVTLTININAGNTLKGDVIVPTPAFRLYYALQLYFANGGGSCYITSVANYSTAAATSVGRYAQMKAGLDAIGKVDEPTMLLFPDAASMNEAQFYRLFRAALKQCAALGNRVTLVDLFTASGTDSFASKANHFRQGIGDKFLSYGAAYYPYLRTLIAPFVNEATQPVAGGTLPAGSVLRLPDDAADLGKSIYHSNNQLYADIQRSLQKNSIVLPPGSAVAGVYCQVDNTRGVWKAPANVSLNLVKEPMVSIDNQDQEDMNITPSGKSVNAIRRFEGRGILVWGARTLAGNDNEWRYISVRRFCIMVEASLKKAIMPFGFEPNDANTWIKLRGMIENFLILQWRAGALMGAKPEQAFFVHVGLGQTMTAQDIAEGRMIAELGLALVRPAEFIILRFSQKMPEPS